MNKSFDTKKTDPSKRKFVSELKAYRDSQKKVFQSEVQDKLKEVYNENFESYLIKYRNLKKMKWWSWLIVLSSVILGIGISFLVGFLTINTTKMPNWQGVVWTSLIITVLLLIIILSLGYTRNQWALEFWNDRVRRYQKTYEDNEAKILHIRNIIIFISLMMAIFTIVASIVFF